MKRILNSALAIVLSITLLPFMSDTIMDVHAQHEFGSWYPMSQACSAYELDTVNDQGKFDYKGCYQTYAEAKNAMKEAGDDAVVRHASSNTQTKIIAMNKGVAYTCNPTGNWAGNTVSFNSSTSANVSSYTTSYSEVHYYDTVSYDGNGNGKVSANVQGFEATINLNMLELIPYKFVDQGLVICLADDLLVKPKISYYRVEQSGNYRSLVFHAYTIFQKNSQDAPECANLAIGPAADWMESGRVYYSLDSVNYYYDRDLTQKAGVYYNYYQYMPLRTQSVIPASAYNGFLSRMGFGSGSALWNTGEFFVNAQHTYGMNAMMIFAQACLETNYGMSDYARNRNNLFGWNAVDSNPDQADTFTSVEACINQQMNYNLRGYLFCDDWRYFGAHFGNKGSGIAVKYASDPYYGMKIASIAYKFDQYYNGFSGNLSEYNAATLGVINTYGAKMYDTPDGTAILTTEYQPGYQVNHTVTILEEKNGLYKVQNENILENGRVVDIIADSSVREYDWNTNIGWMAKSDITVITSNTVIPEPTPIEKIGEVTVNVDGLNIRRAPTVSASATGKAQNGKTYPVYSVTENGGYTWYQISETEYIADDGTWVTYRENGSGTVETPEIPVVPETPAEPEENVDPSKVEIMSALTSIEYNEDQTELHIEGFAFLKGISAKKTTDVKHTIVIVNLEDGTKQEIPAITAIDPNPVDLRDGYTYSASLYSAVIPMSVFANGEYTLRIRVDNREFSDERYLISNRIPELPKVKNEDGTLTRVYPSSINANRFEVSRSFNTINYASINKPTTRFSARSILNVGFDQEILSFEGFGYIYRASMTETDHPDFDIILMDENGKQYTFDTENISSLDYGKLLGYEQKMDYADYNASIPLTDLPVGTYRMYINIKNDTYNDIEELYTYREVPVDPYNYNGKIYHIYSSNVHGRFILEVTE